MRLEAGGRRLPGGTPARSGCSATIGLGGSAASLLLCCQSRSVCCRVCVCVVERECVCVVKRVCVCMCCRESVCV